MNRPAPPEGIGQKPPSAATLSTKRIAEEIGRPALVAGLLLDTIEPLELGERPGAAAGAAAVAAALARLRSGDADTAARSLSAMAVRYIIRAQAARSPTASRAHERAALRLERVAGLLYALGSANRLAVAEPVQPPLFPEDLHA